MSIYPRTVDLLRPRVPPTSGTGAFGALPYQGVEATTDPANENGEDVIAAGLRCSIQSKGMGRVKGLDITAADAPGPVQWQIFVPKSALAKGLARDRDIVVDDEGYRYQIAAAYWNILGHRLLCIRLEV